MPSRQLLCHLLHPLHHQLSCQTRKMFLINVTFTTLVRLIPFRSVSSVLFLFLISVSCSNQSCLECLPVFSYCLRHLSSGILIVYQDEATTSAEEVSKLEPTHFPPFSSFSLPFIFSSFLLSCFSPPSSPPFCLPCSSLSSPFLFLLKFLSVSFLSRYA